MDVSGQLHVPATLSLEERAFGTQFLRGWVSPKTGFLNVEMRKILPSPGLELPPLGIPARNSHYTDWLIIDELEKI